MKFISWNVNGLRAVVGKGFAEIFASLDADFFCLQETKMQAGQLDLAFDGYESYWNYADKKGYSGTAIFTKHTPLSVTYGLGIDEHDHEGRVITLEMPDFYLVTCYTPNSQDGLRRLDYRMTWEDDFRAYLQRLDAKKPVIVCGDLNVAHKEIDLKNPKTNRKNDIDKRPRKSNRRPSAHTFFSKSTRVIGFGRVRIFAFHRHITAERNERNAIFRFPFFEPQQFFAKANGKCVDFYLIPFGDDKMSEFMYENQKA